MGIGPEAHFFFVCSTYCVGKKVKEDIVLFYEDIVLFYEVWPWPRPSWIRL